MNINVINKEVVILISVILGLIVLIAIGYTIYKLGQRDENPESVKIPKSVTGDLTEKEIEAARALAIQLFNDMDGINMTWNNDLYDRVLMLDSRNLLGLSNIFNTLYQVKTGETLSQWLRGENFSWDSYDIQGKVDLILQKLDALQVV